VRDSRPESKTRSDEPDGLIALMPDVFPCDNVNAATDHISAKPLDEVLNFIGRVNSLSRFEVSTIEQELGITLAHTKLADFRYYQVSQATTASVVFPIIQFIQPFLMGKLKTYRLRAYVCPGLNVYTKDIDTHFQEDDHLVADRLISGAIRHSYVVERQRMSAYLREGNSQLALLSWARRDEGPFSEPVQYLVDLLDRLSRLPEFNDANLSHLIGTRLELRPSHNDLVIAKVAKLPVGPVSSIEFLTSPRGKRVDLALGRDRMPIVKEDLDPIYWIGQPLGGGAPFMSYLCEPLDKRRLAMSFEDKTDRLLGVSLGPFITEAD